MGMTTIYLVVNGEILAAYIHQRHAETHALTVTGARVVPTLVLDRLAASVTEDLAIGGELEDDEPTPVQVQLSDITKTRPGTPSAHAREKKRRR